MPPVVLEGLVEGSRCQLVRSLHSAQARRQRDTPVSEVKRDAHREARFFRTWRGRFLSRAARVLCARWSGLSAELERTPRENGQQREESIYGSIAVHVAAQKHSYDTYLLSEFQEKSARATCRGAALLRHLLSQRAARFRCSLQGSSAENGR